MRKVLLFSAVWVAFLVVIVFAGAYLYHNPYLEKHVKCTQLYDHQKNLRAAPRLELNEQLEDSSS